MSEERAIKKKLAILDKQAIYIEPKMVSKRAKAMTTIFDEFVDRLSKPKGNQAFYEKERDKWIADLDALYDKLTGYLQKYIDRNIIHIRRDDIHLNEQYIGGYIARKLIVNFVNNEDAQISIVPHGLYIIGAKGRVDLSGPEGSAILLRVHKDADGPRFITTISSSLDDETTYGDKATSKKPSKPNGTDYVWKFAVHEPNLRYYTLDEETFQNVLMKLIDG